MPHYKMMMGQEFVDLDPVEENASEEDLIGEAAGTSADEAEVILQVGQIGDQKDTVPMSSFVSSMAPVAAQTTMPFTGETADSDFDIPF